MNNPSNKSHQNKPRLGFAGIGWIGKNRLNAILDNQACEMTAIYDPDASVTRDLLAIDTNLNVQPTFEEMLELDLDGIVIASPSALHSEQALKALKKDKAVFCQKPLGRNARETSEVVETARSRNLLLDVDFSYRYTSALRGIREVIQSGELGNIYAVDLRFHNAYGPDKAWYYDREQSGGGCVMDLGIHMIDLLFWLLDKRDVSNLYSRLYNKGRRFKPHQNEVEDYAAVQFTLNNETSVQLACSWNLPLGKDVVINASFYGDKGGASFYNQYGSYYDFFAEKYIGTTTKILSVPPDNWEGRAVINWAQKLAEGSGFDPDVESSLDVARTIDLLYQNCWR